MAPKRAMGALEDLVMEFVWSSAEPVTPADVHQAVAPELAYTTVMTILTRLWQKDLLERERQGRAFCYSPVQSEAAHRAAQMQGTLEVSGDRMAVLSSFVETLGAADAKALKKLLK